MMITSWVITIQMRALSMRIEESKKEWSNPRFDFNADGFGDSFWKYVFMQMHFLVKLDLVIPMKIHTKI